MSEARQEFWRLQIHEVLPSTSDLCRTLAAAGEPEGLAVLARRQTQGRGSRGRDWESPAGNLHLSVLLRPDEPAGQAAQWSLLAGVALAEAIAELLPHSAELELKWPNDLLLGNAKLAGILVDSAARPDGMLDWLAIGIGVNLANAPDVPGRTVACLAEIVPPPAPEDFAGTVLACLGRWRCRRRHEGFAAIRAAWLGYAPEPGRHIEFRLGDRRLGGLFAGLGADGSLLLHTGGGVQSFAAGEVLA
jgi:BirA family biotin operon repressor/biotin-[acetyl-CoA-carboxylase] ligase